MSDRARTPDGVNSHTVDIGRIVVMAFGFALVLFATVGVTAFLYLGHFVRSAHRVRHTELVMRQLGEGLGDLLDTEAGQYGYLLTGDEQFLEPYQRAVQRVGIRFDDLSRLTRDNSTQQRRLRALRTLIEARLSLTADTIDALRGGDRSGAIERVRSRRGKRAMDEIRQRIAEMESEERALLTQRMATAESIAWRMNVLLVFGNGVAFALLAGGTLLLGREINRRRAVEQSMQLQHEREALHEREHEQRRRLAAVLEGMPVGVMLLGAPDGRLLFSNERMHALLGGSLPDPMAHRSGAPWGLFRGDGTPYPHGESPIERALARGETVPAEEIQARRVDGSSIDLVVTAAPVRDSEGKTLGVVAAFDDFSGVKRSEEMRRQAARFHDLFTGLIGHDIRNPLSVITAGAASLARRVQRPEDARIVGRMASSAERMSRMIDQLLDLAEVRLGGGIRIAPTMVDLAAIARRTVERFEVTDPERSIELVYDGDLLGEWDTVRIGQVLTWILSNAFEHGRGQTPVRLTLRDQGAMVVAEVHNQATPIPADLVPLIFDPFRRAEERRRMKSTGLGLGLYLALQIVREHHGEIQVDSSENEGTTFRVVLPRTHEPSQARTDR